MHLSYAVQDILNMNSQQYQLHTMENMTYLHGNHHQFKILTTKQSPLNLLLENTRVQI